MSLVHLSSTSGIGGITHSADFNGSNEYMTFTQLSDNRDTYTLSYWVKYDTFGTTGNRFQTIGVDATTADYSHFLYSNNAGTDTFFLYDAPGELNMPLPTVNTWIHVVYIYDSIQATASDRMKLYYDNVKQSPLTVFAWPSLGNEGRYNASGRALWIGRGESAAGIHYLNGHLADIHLCPGNAYLPTEFAETRDSAWKPKAADVDYATNGFNIRFNDANDLGRDYSGNGNDFTLTNMDSTNRSTDIP